MPKPSRYTYGFGAASFDVSPVLPLLCIDSGRCGNSSVPVRGCLIYSCAAVGSSWVNRRWRLAPLPRQSVVIVLLDLWRLHVSLGISIRYILVNFVVGSRSGRGYAAYPRVLCSGVLVIVLWTFGVSPVRVPYTVLYGSPTLLRLAQVASGSSVKV